MDAVIGYENPLKSKLLVRSSAFFGWLFFVVMFFLEASNKPSVPVQILVALAIGVFMWLWLSALVYVACKMSSKTKARQFRRLELAEHVRGYIFTEEKWTQIYLGQASEFNWDKIRRWRDTELSFVISTGAPEIPIPKRVCSEEEQKALRELLLRKVGPAR